MEYLLSQFYHKNSSLYIASGTSFLKATVLHRSHSQLVIEVLLNFQPVWPSWGQMALHYYFARNKLYHHSPGEEVYYLSPWEKLRFSMEGTKEVSCFDQDFILDALDDRDQRILGDVWKYGRKGGLGMAEGGNLMFDADDIVVHCLALGISNSKEEPFGMVCCKKINPEDVDMFSFCFRLCPVQYTAIGQDNIRTQWVCDEYRFLEVLRRNPYSKTATRIFSEMAEKIERCGKIKPWAL